MQRTLLLLEDNAAKATIIQGLLANSPAGLFVVEWIRTCAAAIDRLADHTKSNIDDVLIDLFPPDG